MLKRLKLKVGVSVIPRHRKRLTDPGGIWWPTCFRSSYGGWILREIKKKICLPHGIGKANF